jgi:hypothetical protein
VTLEMNPSARLNLDAGIFEVSDRQMADIAQQNLGAFLLRPALIYRVQKLCREKDLRVRRAALSNRRHSLDYGRGPGRDRLRFREFHE